MSNYAGLATFLAARKSDQWDAGFADVERLIGRALPASAHKYAAWWANQAGPGHSQTVGWRSVGWKTTALNLTERRVRFVRERLRSDLDLPAIAAAPTPLDGLWRRAEALTGVHDRETIVRLALEALVARESSLQLTALGGSMPDFATPSRERP